MPNGKRLVAKERHHHASGLPQGKPPKNGSKFYKPAVREPASNPSCKRGKVCHKTGRPGCKCASDKCH